MRADAVVDRVINELLGGLAKVKISFASSPVSAVELGVLIDAVVEKKITGESRISARVESSLTI